MTHAQILTAAAVLIAYGCSDSSTGPGDGGSTITPPPPPPSVIRGTIVTDHSRPPIEVVLRLDSGDLVDLVGAQAPRLVLLEGAELQLSGDWTSPLVHLPPYDVTSAFLVAKFLVLTVGGRPAMDGVLKQEGSRYYLDLTDADDVFWFQNTTSELDANTGKRIWVTGSIANPPMRFGVIN